ncbi:portal protein [Pseudomonas sp. C9-3]|uniref:portal protein n=1 Tax=Pseudomonas sp. C9-3 TaxID=3078264 RepID=UPI0028EE06E8|nr:portal protein [Pseudomonas sp. C9-3]
MMKDEEIVREAHERFKRAMEFESDFRKLFVQDLQFCNADSDNGYQWPDDLRKTRADDARPCLTINKTRQHVLQITNDAKQNKPSVKVQATGGSASYDSAQVYEGVVRHIEYISNAQDAYDTALDHQVQGGVGYWRVMTDYADGESFDQEIFIRRVRDPLCVLIDCDAKEADKSDAKWGFVLDDMSRDEFKRQYPKFKDDVRESVLDDDISWASKDSVKVAEYYRCEYEKDELIALPLPAPDGGTYTQVVKLSELPDDMRDVVKADKSIKRRSVERAVWKWYKIGGDQIIDRADWPGAWLPIVQVVGEELLIEGKLERKGHVRNLKDPQRMYNYWTSSAVEQVALQGKQPYVAAVEAIEGFETEYENANRVNYSYLPYNGVDEQGNPIAPPTREQPPVMAQAYISGMQIAGEEMKMVSGQYDPAQGANPLDQSGVALGKQQRKADQATYHYTDNLAKAVRYTGKILLDLIPKIYDTPRVIRILAEDGTDEQVKIDPQSQQAMTEQPGPGDTVQRIFNPAVGQYDVIADTGPSYATRRDEAFDAMSQMMAQDPTFKTVAGDLYFRSANFPMAEELAERFARTIPPELRGEAPPPELVQAQQQIQQMQGQLSDALQALADAQGENETKAQANEINSYKAVTERLDKLIGALTANPAAAVLLEGLTGDTVQAAQADPEPMPPPQQPTPMDMQPQMAAPPDMNPLQPQMPA